MCGISGIVGPAEALTRIETMVAVQSHRGPDDTGVFVDVDAGVALGHNRLSIIDLSAAGRQPMKSWDGRLWIIFNGEVYNYRELRSELSDYPFRTQTDTEVILAAYERWGERCVDRFIGMFAFAIWDRERGRLFCARDRLGIKPFHYIWKNGTFLFASEVKALLAAGYDPSPNWHTWAVYLVHGYYDHSTDTFFEGVQVLSPGHVLVLEDGRLATRRYWDLPALTSEPLQLTDEEAAGRLKELIEDSVRLRLRSDVPVGVNLSGGLDSSSLMVTVDRMLGTDGGIETFTASFSDPRYDEHEFADRVPRRRRWVRNFERLSDGMVWDVAADAMKHQEAPYGGIATLAYHRLHSLARNRGVKVLLEGQGVDEMLAGYDYFRPVFYRDLLAQRRWRRLRQELRAHGSSRKQVMDAVRRVGAHSAEPVSQDGTSHLRPAAVLPEVRALAGERATFPEPYGDRLTNALYRDVCYTKLPRVLRMNDRLSMAFSRELREPYLDHRIVELVFRLPGHQKIRLGLGKFLLREAMAGCLPDDLRLARKRNVVTPQREWLRTSLRPHVEGIIHSTSFGERGLFDPREVRRAFEEFCHGQGENSFFVWQWVTSEHWFRTFLDQRYPVAVAT